MIKLTENINDNFPFISVVHYGKSEYVGIILNQDQSITSLYDFNMIKTDEEKQLFLELGETWWWESNRTIPINIFLKRDMTQFKYIIRTLNSKDVTILLGPTVNLNNLTIKRIKRKIIQIAVKPKL